MIVTFVGVQTIKTATHYAITIITYHSKLENYWERQSMTRIMEADGKGHQLDIKN
jgi:hypothetical protein